MIWPAATAQKTPAPGRCGCRPTPAGTDVVRSAARCCFHRAASFCPVFPLVARLATTALRSVTTAASFCLIPTRVFPCRPLDRRHRLCCRVTMQCRRENHGRCLARRLPLASDFPSPLQHRTSFSQSLNPSMQIKRDDGEATCQRQGKVNRIGGVKVVY